MDDRCKIGIPREEKHATKKEHIFLPSCLPFEEATRARMSRSVRLNTAVEKLVVAEPPGLQVRTQWPISTLCSAVHYSDSPGTFRNTVRCTRHTLSTMLSSCPAVFSHACEGVDQTNPYTTNYSTKGPGFTAFC